MPSPTTQPPSRPSSKLTFTSVPSPREPGRGAAKRGWGAAIDAPLIRPSATFSPRGGEKGHVVRDNIFVYRARIYRLIFSAAAAYKPPANHVDSDSLLAAVRAEGIGTIRSDPGVPLLIRHDQRHN